MQFESVIESESVEFRGKPKSMAFLFLAFSLLSIAISAAGFWATFQSPQYKPAPAAAPLIVFIFVAAPLFAITGLYFGMRKEFRSMSVDRTIGEIAIVWMGLFSDRREVISLADVGKFTVRYVPKSNRSSGWMVELNFKNGLVMDTGKFDDEAPTRTAVEAANRLIEN